jgi:hypothetical protein
MPSPYVGDYLPAATWTLQAARPAQPFQIPTALILIVEALDQRNKVYLWLFQHGRSPEWLGDRRSEPPKKSDPSSLPTMKPLSICTPNWSGTSSRKKPKKPIEIGKSRLISRVYRVLYRASSA